jgi:Cellulase (glycosyl hydrolase family 5)
MASRSTLIAATLALMISAAVPVAVSAKTDSLPVGRCVNMGNHLEAPSEVEWGGKKIEAADMDRIARAGFQTIRLPVRWSTRASATAPYTIEPAFMKRVKTVVADARNAGLNVILDSHHFEEIHKDPSAANIARLAGMWKQIAAEFAKEPEANLWFEIENEPHEKFNDSNLLKVLSPALAEIRKSNPTRPVIIGGEFWSGINSLKSLKLPDDPNIVPTFHYYDPFDFTHQGATWVDNPPKMGRAYGSAADQKLLQDDVQKIRDYTERTGKTPFMGEFGANNPIPLNDRVKYQKTVRQAFDAVGIGMCAWGYTNTFPLWDQQTGKWVPGMLDAMGLKEQEPPIGVGAGTGSKQATPELQMLDDATPGTLINDPTRLDWAIFGTGQTSKVVKSPDIPGGGAALQITIPRAGATLYENGTNAPIDSVIKAGTDITALFWARATKSAASDGKGRIGVRFQQNVAPYAGFGDTTLLIGNEWKQYEVTARADRDISMGQAVMGFQLSGAKQTIEIGQTIIVSGAKSILSQQTSIASAIDLHPKLVGKGEVITDYSKQDWPIFGAGETHKTVPAKEVPGGQAVQFSIAAAGANPYDIGLSIPVTKRIEEGKILILAVLARTVSAETPDGKGKIGVRVQDNAPPYPGFAENTISIGPNWGLYQLRTQARMTIEAGKGAVGVHIAGAKQVIEIGQVYLLDTSAVSVSDVAPAN